MRCRLAPPLSFTQKLLLRASFLCRRQHCAASAHSFLSPLHCLYLLPLPLLLCRAGWVEASPSHTTPTHPSPTLVPPLLLLHSATPGTLPFVSFSIDTSTIDSLIIFPQLFRFRYPPYVYRFQTLHTSAHALSGVVSVCGCVWRFFHCHPL